MIKIAQTKVLPINSIKFIDGNREVVQSHVQKMYNLIDENGFADTIKVAIKDGEYYAVEGQHRIVALKIHGIKEVPCSVVDWIDDDFEEIQSFIIDLNAHNKQWTLYDYVKSWADKKIPEYTHLRNQMISYQKTLSNGVVATSYDGVSRTHPNLKKGNLKFIDKPFSDTLTETFSDMVTKWGKKRLPAQVMRQASVNIMGFKDDRYGMLRAFKLASVNHLTTSVEPLPDGDESFSYWFEHNVVKGTYETLIKNKIILKVGNNATTTKNTNRNQR